MMKCTQYFSMVVAITVRLLLCCLPGSTLAFAAFQCSSHPHPVLTTSYCRTSTSTRSIASQHGTAFCEESSQHEASIASSRPHCRPKNSKVLRRHRHMEAHAMTSISPNPLLFGSSETLLSSQECQTLSSWCQRAEIADQSLGGLLSNPACEHQEGTVLLKRLQRIIHHSVLGLHLEDHNYVVPRFLHYKQEENENNIQGQQDREQQLTLDQLVPNGLHMDTNNNKHFRHWTILMYLDSPPTASSGGATTFPLAERYPSSLVAEQQQVNNVSFVPSSSTTNASNGPIPREEDEEEDEAAIFHELSAACKAARELAWYENIHHTRISEDAGHQTLGRIIEQAAFDLYREETTPSSTGCSTSSSESPIVLSDRGFRVIPRQGHICLFSGLQHDGYPNPLSFHAGESVLSEGATKNVLSFFYEIPIEDFSSRAAFGEQVREREEAFSNFHASGGSGGGGGGAAGHRSTHRSSPSRSR